MVDSIDSSTDCRYDTEISVRCQQELAKDNSIELSSCGQQNASKQNQAIVKIGSRSSYQVSM